MQSSAFNLRNSPWFLINLGDATLVDNELELLRQRLSVAFTQAGSPKNMAAFMRHEADGRLHCEVKIYLSPTWNSTAKVFQATPCKKPSASDLSLLIGCQGAWSALFPKGAN